MNELSVSDEDKEALTTEVPKENDKNIFRCCYRPPSSDREDLSMFLQNSAIVKIFLVNKLSYILGDFNINCLSYLQ